MANPWGGKRRSRVSLAAEEHGRDGGRCTPLPFANRLGGSPDVLCQRSGVLSGLWKNCASGVGSKTGTGWKPAVVSP